MTARIAPAAAGMTVGAVTATGATHLAVDLVGGGFSALLPTIAERLSLSSTGVGVLVAAIPLLLVAASRLLPTDERMWICPSTSAASSVGRSAGS
jgi:hypothetical protein